MEIKSLLPRRGKDCLRLDDGDELVIVENFGALSQSDFRITDHCLIIICIAGMAQFDYDGHQIQLQKNDLYLCMANSVVSNFMSSPDFNCRQIWFSRGELWNINVYGETSLIDLTYLKHHPKVHLDDDDAILLDEYFQLLCRRMRGQRSLLYVNIVRSIVSTMMLEMLCMMRKGNELEEKQDIYASTSPDFHKRKLTEQFVQMVEQSDGRIRKVDSFASQLNVTPKYLSNVLKETMNRRPSHIIRFFTLKAIDRRLRFTDMTMQEIANDLSFPNASFFGKYFKEHSGVTPLEFRRKYQK